MRHVLDAQGVHGFNPTGLVVQASNVVKCFAACMQKRFLSFLRNFFQGFEAVAGEARANQIDALDPPLRHLDQSGFGVGL